MSETKEHDPLRTDRRHPWTWPVEREGEADWKNRSAMEMQTGDIVTLFQGDGTDAQVRLRVEVLPEPPSPPSEPEVDEERWAFREYQNGKHFIVVRNEVYPSRVPAAGDFPVRVVSKAKWDAMEADLNRLAGIAHEDGWKIYDLREQVFTLTHERDDLSRKLAVAEGELTLVRQERDEALNRVKLAERIASMDSDLLVRPQQPPSPSSGPADEGWIGKAWDEYVRLKGSLKYDLVAFACALRRHAPAARYPEVVEFLDAVGSGPWSMSAGSCEGKASYYVQSFRITKGTWFADDTLAAACRAALDSRKERSDG